MTVPGDRPPTEGDMRSGLERTEAASRGGRREMVFKSPLIKYRKESPWRDEGA